LPSRASSKRMLSLFLAAMVPPGVWVRYCLIRIIMTKEENKAHKDNFT
jgi:hypothetical protein